MGEFRPAKGCIPALIIENKRNLLAVNIRKIKPVDLAVQRQHPLIRKDNLVIAERLTRVPNPAERDFRETRPETSSPHHSGNRQNTIIENPAGGIYDELVIAPAADKIRYK